MKRCIVPPLLNQAIKKLRKNLGDDLAYFWPAKDSNEMHEENLILQLGAILKENACIYAEVAIDQPGERIDFVALPDSKNWFLLSEAKRGYNANQIQGILRDIKRIERVAKGKILVLDYNKYKRAFGLILITLWEGRRGKGRTLLAAWNDNLHPANKDYIVQASISVVEKLNRLNARRQTLLISDHKAQEKHYLLYAVFEILLQNESLGSSNRHSQLSH